MGQNGLTYKQYKDAGGKIDGAVIHRRLGSWNKALCSAGLTPIRRVNLSDEDLFDNIHQVWIQLGHQPTRRDIDSSLSKYSSRPYLRRFGGWRDTLEAFVVFIESDVSEESDIAAGKIDTVTRRTSRDPSLRLRFKVMRRDGYKCVHCGASPANEPGVELHIDHIVAWSKGGETQFENLQTLCSKCNFGKGNEDER